MKNYYVYIATNYMNTVFYTGVTNDLVRRMYEHKERQSESFTKRYNVNKLVYFEVAEEVESAILREKQIKAGSRAKKIALIVKENPEYRDLYSELL